MPKRRRLGGNGFSLIEVVAALGIVSFTIVPLIGLLTIGLGNSRSNLDHSIEAQIVGWAQGYVHSQGTEAPDSYRAPFDEFGISTSLDKAAFVAQMDVKTVALPGATSSLKSWSVVVTSPVRGNQTLGKYVVWNTR